MYYNYPPGKANIGASYLNVADSLANMLAAACKAEGYDVGDADLSADAVLADITTKARNVGSYAPGRARGDDRARRCGARVAAEYYAAGSSELAPALRDKIVEDWGDRPRDQADGRRSEGGTDARRARCALRQRRAAAAAGARLGRGPRQALSREGSLAAPSILRGLRVAAQVVQGGRGRARRHARHARVARRQGCRPDARTMRPTR